MKQIVFFLLAVMTVAEKSLKEEEMTPWEVKPPPQEGTEQSLVEFGSVALSTESQSSLLKRAKKMEGKKTIT